MPYSLGCIYLEIFKLIWFSDFTCISSELTLLVKTKFLMACLQGFVRKILVPEGRYGHPFCL